MLITTQALWYRAAGNADPKSHDLFTDLNPKRHAETRRKVANLYSMTSLLQLEPFVTSCTEKLVEKFEEFATSKQTFDMQHWLQCYAFDMIGLITVRPSLQLYVGSWES